MKNSELWFDFAQRAVGIGPQRIEIEGRSSLTAKIAIPPSGSEFSLGLIPVNEEEIAPSMRSGEPTGLIRDLDDSLRDYRRTAPKTPLAAYLRPAAYWTRGPAWMIGEYLAERDLLLWVDLLHLHPQQAVAWGRLTADCGLACARTLVLFHEKIERDDVPLLMGTGTWLLQMNDSGVEGSIQQV
ncbi:MAG: hypothetical protein KC978_19360 [Candidatus Omnitrophica bacterium]|nr:hypothetical protein [Candidatus Omnitrophota bacterium]